MIRLILLYIFLCGAVFASSVPNFAQIDIQFAEDFKGPLGEKVRFTWHSDKTTDILSVLAQYKGIDATVTGDGQMQIVASRDASYQGSALEQHSQASFVIDLEEPDTQVFLNDFQTEKQNITLKNIKNFVYQYMTDPTYAEGFNIASAVARTRRGDCTEYAMLTTALARFLGLPARYMVGTIIVQEREQISAYGHAWTEVLVDSKWQILDAAMYHPERDFSSIYLPYGELSNEGPGFTWSLVLLNQLAPKSVTNFENSL